MKVYYAHCQAIYNTVQEQRDMDMLHKLGFEVVNPSDKAHIAEVINLKTLFDQQQASLKIMAYFTKIVIECDALAFRAMPDGSIGAGVFEEISVMQRIGKPIFELPSGILLRRLSIEQTREYLKECG
jgi:hypothetical protein